MTSRVFSLAIVALVAGPLFAQAQTVKPNAGQSEAQMQKDMAECHAIAQQAGATAEEGSRRAGGRLRGAAVGGAAGAARAEVQGQQHPGYDRVPDDVQKEYRQNQAESAA